MKAITLVLGSGGARGLCFLGALKALESESIPIKRIIGTSMGAIIGAAYCSGVPVHEIEQSVALLRLRNLLAFDPFGPSLASHRKLFRRVEQLVPIEDFAKLKMPLSVVCTDMETGEAVVYESGPLIPPVVGSGLGLGLFDPIRHQGKWLVDGGYSNPLPVSVAQSDEIIVAVDANVDPCTAAMPNLTRRVANLVKIPNIMRQTLRSIDILVHAIAEEKASHYPHVRIKPRLHQITFFDFHRAEECIADGENAVRGKLEEIRQVTG